jgi:hypothetical protein
MSHDELSHLMSLVHTFDVDHKGQVRLLCKQVD